MKTIVIDDNAHQIMKEWKQSAQDEGIEKPTHAQAIRWARDHQVILDAEITELKETIKEYKKEKKQKVNE